MKKHLFVSLVLIFACFLQNTFAQTTKKIDTNHFNEQAAHEQAKAKGIKSSDIEGYVQFLRNDFSSKKALAKQPHIHTPYEGGSTGIQETVIYLEPNKPMSLGCPNMAFEQYNFNGWTGSTGSVSIGTGYPNYNSTGASIVNSAGNNVSLVNTMNYHTLMTLPAVNSNYSSLSGYDSLACKAVGAQTISQIPFVSPFSFDPVSVRMNGAIANYRACRLKYITTSSSTNQRLSYSYALVFHDPSLSATPHTAGEAPYFKVTVRNEATNTELVGCTSYSFNPITAQPSDSLETSVTATGDPVLFRKWNYYSVDLSSLPSGTPVSINFEVGGCTNGGHFSYAYIDAECGGIGTSYANMCSGSNFATLVAPTGFNSYQWYDPSGTLIPGPNGTNDTLTQSPATTGTTYSVNMISPGGCIISQTVTIGFTTVNIINLNATSSCADGTSGTAYVQANGSNGIYTYQWTSTSGGTNGNIVSTAQTATGLPPGTYSVLVSSTTCGQASANLSVGVSPPFFLSQNKSFCGNAAAIPLPSGSNYLWYDNNNVPIPAPIGTNDTLYINNAADGDIYTAVYDNAQGCRDSIAYTLNLVAGGTSYFSNTTNVCPNDSNGTTILNLSTPFAAPYSYLVTGPTVGNTILNTSTSATFVTMSSLAPGTYTAMVNDGLCIYNNTVTVGVIPTNFTVTPTNTVLCFPEEAVLNLDFGNSSPISCGVDPLLCSGGTPTALFATGTFTQNGSTNYPTPYGNWYTYGRTQFLVRKSELNAAGITAGRISSLAFNVLNLNTSALNYPDFSIKMGCTSLSALPNASSAGQPFITGLQTVYSNPNQSVSLGWITHTFSQSYLWDGNSNVIIEVCFSFPNPTGIGNYTQNVSVQLKQMSYIANMHHVEDTNPVCGGTQQADNGFAGPMTNGENMLPNMKFGYCSYAQPASAYTVSVSSNGTITTNYGNDSLKVAPASGTPPASGSIIYTVSVTNPIGGCIATRTVEVLYPPVTTSITTAGGNVTICEGSTTNLSATGAFNYEWFYQVGAGGPLQSIATTSGITVIPPAVGVNTYVVTGNSPCPSSTPDTKTVTVNVIPKANLIVTPLPDVTKCLNTPFVFNTATGSSTPGNSGTPYSYSWTELPGNTPAPGVNTASSYTANSNSTTTLVVAVSGSCAISTSDTVVVKNFVDDLGIAISNSITTCPNKPLAFNSTTTGGHAIYNYTWTVNSVPVANTPNLNYTSPSSGGTYNVVLTVMDSCAYQKTDTKAIVVLPNTLAIAIVDSVSLCGNTAFTLNSASSGGYPNYTYQWFLLPNNTNLSNTTGLSSTTPANEGIYSIQVVISDSCGYQMSDIQIINVLPPCQVEIPNVITPNGDLANEYFKIKNLEYHPNTNVTIFDRWGLKIYENNNYNNEWKADGVNDGTYFYVIDVPQDKKYSGFITVFKGK